MHLVEHARRSWREMGVDERGDYRRCNRRTRLATLFLIAS